MAKAKQHEERILARRQALQVLYQADILRTSALELVDSGSLLPEVQGLSPYARFLIEGTETQRDQLDERIMGASENWTMERMPVVDRSLLRLAAFEMLNALDVPVSVSINEAVNLAREFGGEDSPRFVNGILGRIARHGGNQEG